MTTSSGSNPSSAASSTSGMSEAELDEQPFDVNGPVGADEKKSAANKTGDGMSEAELDEQPFDVNGPATAD